jgi:SAF domain
MNRTRLLLIGFIALSLGAFVSFAVYGRLKMQSGGSAQPGATVVVAARDLGVGAKVEDRDVKTLSIPQDDVPPGCIRNPSKAVGRGVILPIYQGQFVLNSMLAPENAGIGLPSLIPTGMRAVSVRHARDSSRHSGNRRTSERRRPADCHGTEERSGDCGGEEFGSQQHWRRAGGCGHHLAGFTRRRPEIDVGQPAGEDSAIAAQPARHQARGVAGNQCEFTVSEWRTCSSGCHCIQAQTEEDRSPGTGAP